MSLSIALNINIWFLITNFKLYSVMAHIIDCQSNQCENTIINCLPNEDCFISCTETQSCSGSMINCPLFGHCNIDCSGPYSCQYLSINATLSTGDFNIFCEQSTDHCKRMKIYGSILDTNTGHFAMSCNGELTSCINSEIHCPIHGDCNITCNAETSCKWSQIIGPHDGHLNIHCNGSQSCHQSVFNATQSTQVDIIGCKNSDSCGDLSLYCPPHTNQHKHCHIQANNNIGTKIYAIFGWSDIDIFDHNDINSSDMHHNNAIMFCGNDYDILCPISTNDWSCITDDCNFDMYSNASSSTDNMQHNFDSNANSINSAAKHKVSIRIQWWPFGAKILFGVSVILIIVIVGLFYYFRKRGIKKERFKRKRRKDFHRLQSKSETESLAEVSKSITNTCTELNNTFTPSSTVHVHYTTHTKARSSIDCGFNFQTNVINSSQTNEGSIIQATEMKISNDEQNDHEHEHDDEHDDEQKEEQPTVIIAEIYSSDESEIENENDDDCKKITVSKMGFISRIRSNSQNQSCNYQSIQTVNVNEELDAYENKENMNVYNESNESNENENNYNYTMTQLDDSDAAMSDTRSVTAESSYSEGQRTMTMVTTCSSALTAASQSTQCTISTCITQLSQHDTSTDDETICQSYDPVPNAC